MPFTGDEFFRVFADYNSAIWPAQLVLVALAFLAVLAAVLRTSRVTSAILAALFAWCGIVYHWTWFAAVTPAARVFGALFLFGAIAFAATSTRVEFMAANRARIAIGSAFIAYALAGYPLLASALGHRYPATPTFGAPCPTTIFALGLLMTARPPLPVVTTVAPVLWAAIASTVAFRFGVLEDLGLLAAGLVLAALGIPRLATRLHTANQ